MRSLFARLGLVSMKGRNSVRYALRGIGMILAVGILVSAALAQGEERDEAAAVVHNTAGEQIGVVTFRQDGGKMLVHAQLSGLTEGFHGFHVHAVGECTGNFTGAGGHLNPTGLHHPGHPGDMPALLAHADGAAELSFVSDRLKMADLFDPDGSAVIVHADPDNYGHIPTRYAPEPDATSLGTGDAGARIACGVIR